MNKKMKMRSLNNNKGPLKFLNNHSQESKSSFNLYLSNQVKKCNKSKLLKTVNKMKKMMSEKLTDLNFINHLLNSTI